MAISCRISEEEFFLCSHELYAFEILDFVSCTLRVNKKASFFVFTLLCNSNLHVTPALLHFIHDIFTFKNGLKMVKEVKSPIESLFISALAM